MNFQDKLICPHCKSENLDKNKSVCLDGFIWIKKCWNCKQEFFYEVKKTTLYKTKKEEI